MAAGILSEPLFFLELLVLSYNISGKKTQSESSRISRDILDLIAFCEVQFTAPCT